MRGGRITRQLPRHFALLRIFAAPIIAEGDRPGADAVLAPARRKAPAVSDRLLGIRIGTFGRVKVPPSAAGADEFGGYGHRALPFGRWLHSTTISSLCSTLPSRKPAPSTPLTNKPLQRQRRHLR